MSKKKKKLLRGVVPGSSKFAAVCARVVDLASSVGRDGSPVSSAPPPAPPSPPSAPLSPGAVSGPDPMAQVLRAWFCFVPSGFS